MTFKTSRSNINHKINLFKSMTHLKISPLEGCAPIVAIAVDKFFAEIEPYSVDSRKTAIASLFNRHIETAWKQYAQTLPKTQAYSELISNISFLDIARKNEFRGLEDMIRVLLQYSPDTELSATLFTLKNVAIACQFKKPKRRLERRYIEPLAEICYYCGEETELFEALGANNKFWRDKENSIEIEANLSPIFCSRHRSKLPNGNINPLYQSAKRDKDNYDLELTFLLRQTRSNFESLAQSGISEVDQFHLKLQQRNQFAFSDESILKNEAARLRYHKIDNVKKSIIILSDQAMRPIDIAKKLGLTSSQKVKNILKSVPEFYRLDLGIKSYESYKFQIQRDNSKLPGIKIEELEIVIGNAIWDALRDPKISEINLYPDGSLFFGYKTNEKINAGRIEPAHATSIIYTIAKFLNVTVSDHGRSVYGFLEFIPARFTAILPPVTPRPTFFLKKREI